MDQQLQYTQPTQIMGVSPELKTIQTKFGEKQKFVIKDAENNYYDIWGAERYEEMQNHKTNGTKVVIGYTSKYHENKEYKTLKHIGISGGQSSAPQISSSKGSNSSDNRQDSIERQCSIKTASELICAGKAENLIETAEKILKWIQNKPEPGVPAPPPLPVPEDTINVEDIPF